MVNRYWVIRKNIIEFIYNLFKCYLYKLILLCSLVYLFPVFQYSAIWGNNHITALIFFTIGIFFHLKLKDCNYKSF